MLVLSDLLSWKGHPPGYAHVSTDIVHDLCILSPVREHQAIRFLLLVLEIVVLFLLARGLFSSHR